MKDKCFLDTNVLIYAWDNNEIEKKKRINSFLRTVEEDYHPVISTQTLGEFFNIGIKKIGLTKDQAVSVCQKLSLVYPVYEITTENVFHAMNISKETQFSYWDSLIVAMAVDTGCTILYSEDLNNGQEIEGVKIVNPFVE